MATTTTKGEAGSASLLQKERVMKLRVVAILAAGLLSACGVGVEGEEAEGEAAGTARASLQLGCVDVALCPELVATPRPPSNPVAAPGTVGLPQDPIPWRPPVGTAERPFGPGTLPEGPLPRR